ncbi:hypothetical protein [Streptomyces cylindrosporus]|uniref:Uncharacterized protein n=1 Tax=Streptomyces cylindrosporus TaxID=2927583 RepID=A0ABS9YPE5_9ACTN|nr:hypothetical protein [Streptomyces cylindrosporus]MCI3279148.1 hypothetical protein [Streptomyces cylindrosporus]
MSEPEPGQGEYEMVMPIILAKTNGGPYDDAAVVAGMTCGALDQELAMAKTLHTLPRERYLDARLLEQADLIAMKHGYMMKRGDLDEASGWQEVTFEWA